MADIQALIAELQAKHAGKPGDLVNAFDKALDDAPADERGAIEEAIRQTYVSAGGNGLETEQRRKLVDWAVYYRKFGLLVALGDEATFALALERTSQQLDTDYYDTKREWFDVLAELALGKPARIDRTIGLLADAYPRLTRFASAKDTLRNSVGWDVVARTLGRLGDPRGGTTILDGLRAIAADGGQAAHYELMCTVGGLGVALSLLEALPEGARQEATALLDGFIKEQQGSYQGQPFMLEALYARCLLEGDASLARAYLADSKNKTSLGLAAAALADLDDKAALPMLEARAKTLENPVAGEEFAEAIARLERQTGRPAPRNRMILFYGSRTPSERALGEETDNLFIVRARERTKNAELGAVTEADASAPND